MILRLAKWSKVSSLLLCLALATSAIACEQMKSRTTDQPGVLDGPVILSVSRQFDPASGARPVSILMASEHTYRCFNYRILYELEREDEELRLSILGAELPGETCLTALGPARAVDYTDLSPGNYRLRVLMDGQEDVYHIEITEGDITMEPEEPPTISRGARIMNTFQSP